MFSKRSPCWLCLAQWFPGESESPFGAVGHCLCRAWNPIISTAMLALWHQTPLMQNAIWCRLPATRFTVQLLQRCSLMGGLTDRRGKRGWDGLLTTVTLMRDMERGVQGLETAGNENRMWTIMVILNNNYIKIPYTKWQVKMRNIYISINTTNALLYCWDIIIKNERPNLNCWWVIITQQPTEAWTRLLWFLLQLVATPGSSESAASWSPDFAGH